MAYATCVICQNGETYPTSSSRPAIPLGYRAVQGGQIERGDLIVQALGAGGPLVWCVPGTCNLGRDVSECEAVIRPHREEAMNETDEQALISRLKTENEALRSLLRQIVEDASQCAAACNVLVSEDLIDEAKELLGI